MSRRVHPAIICFHRHDRWRVHKPKSIVFLQGRVVLGSRIPANLHPLTAGEAILLAVRLGLIHFQLRYHRVVHNASGRRQCCVLVGAGGQKVRTDRCQVASSGQPSCRLNPHVSKFRLLALKTRFAACMIQYPVPGSLRAPETDVGLWFN
jgi:hypothetical protein